MTVRIIKLPDVGEGVAEAEIVEWHIAPGDWVTEDQPLAGVSTDKVTVEIPSPVTGRIVSLGADVGTILAVGAELTRIEVSGGADAVVATPQPAPVANVQPALHDKPMASPAVRKRALEAAVDLRQVEGTGPGGRIRHQDLDRLLQRRAVAAPPITSPEPASPQVTSPEPAAPPITGAVQEIRLSGVRRVIAQRMAEATRRIAHFSYIEEVDVTAVEELRAVLLRDAAPGKPRLTLLAFLILAIVRALHDFPQMNALFDDEAEIIRRHASVHMGIATQTPSGLMVPVLRNAETRGLWDCAAAVAQLARSARDGTARREELAGSTITITSLGALGGLATTPVINRPEVAIVGVNKIAIRPLWRDGAFVPRQMMNLSSSFDHRVIDGQEASLFIQRIKRLLETPASIFIQN